MLSPRQRAFVWALAHVLVPDARNLSEERKTRFFETIDELLATRPPSVVRLIGVFLVFLRWFPLLRFGGRLDHLAPESQIRALRWFEDAPVGLIRSGFWGVKTLVYMGYYTQPEIALGLGYAPSKSGNEKLHA
jgi:hypothetical protein